MEIRNPRKLFRGSVSDFGRVGVLFGGLSAEREVSLKSGQAILDALLKNGVDAHPIDCGADMVAQLLDAKFDRVFIALHGVGGEDGKVQAILESLGVPFTGSDFASSALGMNKLRTKQVWQSVGLPTPAYRELHEDCNWQRIIDDLGGKAFVKPVREGSSIGMSVAASAEALKESFEAASQFDDQIIAEQAISGAEFTVAVLNGRALPPVNVVAGNEFYDFQAKYESTQTQYICPVDLPLHKLEQLKSLAINAFESLGCSGWGRVDVMQDKVGQFYLLEVNTVPGMTNHSLVPKAAKEEGFSFEELVLDILAQTLQS